MVINVADSKLGVFGNKNVGLQLQPKDVTASKSESGTVNVDGAMLQNNLFESNPAAQKKEAAKKQAYQVVKDAFDKDQAVRGSKDEIKERNAELRAERKGIRDEIEQLENLKEELVEQGISDEDLSELEGIIKGRQQRLADATVNMDRELISNHAATRNITESLLKSQEMLDATDKADGIMEAASKEYVGSLIQEAVDSMDEKREEEKEQAEEAEEKKAEEQEKIDAAKEKAEQTHAVQSETGTTAGTNTDNRSVPLSSQSVQNLPSVQDEVQQALKKIMMEENLLPEDLKGMIVDQTE